MWKIMYVTIAVTIIAFIGYLFIFVNSEDCDDDLTDPNDLYDEENPPVQSEQKDLDTEYKYLTGRTEEVDENSHSKLLTNEDEKVDTAVESENEECHEDSIVDIDQSSNPKRTTRKKKSKKKRSRSSKKDKRKRSKSTQKE